MARLKDDLYEVDKQVLALLHMSHCDYNLMIT